MGARPRVAAGRPVWRRALAWAGAQGRARQHLQLAQGRQLERYSQRAKSSCDPPARPPRHRPGALPRRSFLSQLQDAAGACVPAGDAAAAAAAPGAVAAPGGREGDEEGAGALAAAEPGSGAGLPVVGGVPSLLELAEVVGAGGEPRCAALCCGCAQHARHGAALPCCGLPWPLPHGARPSPALAPHPQPASEPASTMPLPPCLSQSKRPCLSTAAPAAAGPPPLPFAPPRPAGERASLGRGQQEEEVAGPASPLALVLSHEVDAARGELVLHCRVHNRTLEEVRGVEVRGWACGSGGAGTMPPRMPPYSEGRGASRGEGGAGVGSG